MKFHKRLLSLVLCAVMMMSFIPFTATAENTTISVVNLNGAKDIITAGRVDTYKNAVYIDDGDDRRFSVVSVYCVEKYDNEYLHGDDELESGVQYVLRIYLYPASGYSFPYSTEDVRVKMDGKAVADENLTSHSVVGVDGRCLQVEIPFTLGGVKKEYVTDMYLITKEEPLAGATPSRGTDACDVPIDAPYEITDAEWRYTPGNGYLPSKNFSENNRFYLWIDLKAKEGENIRFSNTKQTSIHVEGFTNYTGCWVYRRPNGTCRVELEYNISYPPTYTISYDPCGGTFPDGSTEIFTGGYTRSNGAVSHLFSEMKKPGFNFIGWYTAPTGGEEVTTATTFSTSVTLYAQYEECIDEIYIDNFMKPTAGKHPIFTATIPEDAPYKIEDETWTDGDYIVSSSEQENNRILELESQTSKPILLRTFNNEMVYTYSIKLSSTNGMKFGKYTNVYVNGSKMNITGGSSFLYIDVSYDCISPKTLEVYDGATIKSGVVGTSIETINLSDYVRSPGLCTFSSDDKPSWISLSSIGVLTGTRPSTAMNATSFTVEVSDSTGTQEMVVSVGAVTSNWEIIKHPENVIADYCLDMEAFMVETSASNPTYVWEIKTPDNSGWYKVSDVAALLDLHVADHGDILSIGIDESNPVDLNGCLFRCKVSCDGITKYSNTALYTVYHDYDGCEYNNATKHDFVCDVCGSRKTTEHNFYYSLVKSATAEENGIYSATCADCGHYYTNGYAYGSTDNAVLTLNFNGGGFSKLNEDPKHLVEKQNSNVRPSTFYPVRTGFAFMGWAVNKDATEPLYRPDDYVFMAQSMTLYAVWKPIEILVGGITVTIDNMNDVLGDGGTVTYLPPTLKHKPTIILNGANIQSSYILSLGRRAGIYATCPIEIFVTGNNNQIHADGATSSGIIDKAEVFLSGEGLKITADSSYFAGIESKYAEIGIGSLTISNAKHGIAGNAEFYSGRTEIIAGLYKNSDHSAVSEEVYLYPDFDVNVYGTDSDMDEYELSTIYDAIYMRRTLIEPVKEANTILHNIGVSLEAPKIGQKPYSTVNSNSSNYKATLTGWFIKSYDNGSFPGIDMAPDDTFTVSEDSVYLAQIELTPNSGYEFADQSDLSVIVNDEEVDLFKYEHKTSYIRFNENQIWIFAVFTCNPFYGDANDDGTVDMKDVLAVRKFIAKLPTTLIKEKADVNVDNDVDMKDVLAIRKYLVGTLKKLGLQE